MSETRKKATLGSNSTPAHKKGVDVFVSIKKRRDGIIIVREGADKSDLHRGVYPIGKTVHSGLDSGF